MTSAIFPVVKAGLKFALLSTLKGSLAATALFIAPTGVQADQLTDRVLDQHILPTYERLADRTAALAQLSEQDCNAQSEDLQAAFGAALDAWVAASHLRFGPSEAENRAFAIAFWPDGRGRIPKALRQMILDESRDVDTPGAFSETSIAARGLYPMEFMLHDAEFTTLGTAAYRCQLIQAMAADTAENAAVILRDWRNSYADEMRSPGARYQSESEVHQELFKALNTGLEVLVDMRLGRPLGSFDAPRPLRAEARRSGRSLNNVIVQITALRDLAQMLAASDPALVQALDTQFDLALDHASTLADDPRFAGVSDPIRRFRIEALQEEIRRIQTLSSQSLGPILGVQPGFNALDGD